MPERTYSQTKAMLITRELHSIEIEETIRCTGLDADDCCANIPYRDGDDCRGCGLTHLVNSKNNQYQILLVGKGTFRRTK